MFTRQIRHFALTPSCRSTNQALTVSEVYLLSISTPTTTPSTPSPSLSLRIKSKIRNHASWTAEADALLLDLRAQGQTWNQIGQALGKSRQACNRRFDAVLDPEMGTAFWTQQPDRNQTLRQLVTQGFGWKHIATQLETKASACEKQWRTLERERILASAGVVVEAVTTKEGEHGEKNQDHSSDVRTKSSQFRTANVQLLNRAVIEYGTDQWERIAERVFESRFSPTYLRLRYAKLERSRKIWTEEQDEHLLMETVRCYKSNPLPAPSTVVLSSLDVLSKSQWETVACVIPGEHTATECRERWLRLQLNKTGRRIWSSVLDINDGENMTRQQKPLASRVAWTPEQSQRLESIVLNMKRGSINVIEWGKVSTLMDREFTKEQCESRWNRLVRRTNCTSRGRWNNEEIDSLIRGICDLGDQWTKISQKWVPGRTPKTIQGKWKTIVSKLNQEMVIRRWTWPVACTETFGEQTGMLLGELPSRWPNLCQMPM
ncbi:hypothetical protein BGZ65_000662 [Modicella reniformis]|uniref:Myb-like domain-containing protein n=1 Tax=Modicella reniformis TaxID=1440133 RepID=A0A9P6MBR9_9FUNG|nr:hypothetical protein BGZ65_000662 [Modicella reniformis]